MPRTGSKRSRLEAVAKRYYDLQEEIGVLMRTTADMLTECFRKMTKAEKKAYDRAVAAFAGESQMPVAHSAHMWCIAKLPKPHQEMYRALMRKVLEKQRQAEDLFEKLAKGVKELGMVGGKRRKTQGKRGRKGKRVSTRRRRR